MDINQKMQMVLNTLVRPGVEYNLQQMAYAGASFIKTDNGTISGLVASPYFIIELENAGIAPEGEFYHYITNTWQPCPYPIPIQEIFNRLRSPQFIGKMVLPFKTTINHLNKMEDQYKRKCRIIASPNQLFSTDIVMRFTFENGHQVFRHPALKKPCIVADNSVIPANMIAPTLMYKAVIVSENDSAYLVNVVAPYSKVQVGINYSEHGFFPDNLEIINRLVNIPPDFIMGTNTVEPAQNFTMPAIHLDCTLFYDLLRVFGIMDTQFVEVHFGADPNTPVLLRNIKQTENDMQINIVLATLNPFYGAQRR